MPDRRGVRLRHPLVLLHGFAGTRHTWDGVIQRLAPERYTPLALDLPGHGEARDAPTPITFAACVEHVLANSPARFALCGYSLGGRVGLNVALAAPERVSRLVLVSSTAGIADEADRAARVGADNALADDLEKRPFTEFMDRWQAQPLFAGDPPEVHAAMRAEQQRNDPRALAAVLRGIGTGMMSPLWDRLGELRMPVTVLVGERDFKFHAPARRLAASLPDSELRMAPGGHRLTLENPQCVADALQGGA
ncbi:MAG TPA: alpha/beta fold hydrolase [Solirubrobacteraceae bacterium]|jgi:2-succinyl-6-hydroxy-2,4-cyclohexadiene-1-carboxylate synthase